jgi:hypothetical protein
MCFLLFNSPARFSYRFSWSADYKKLVKYLYTTDKWKIVILRLLPENLVSKGDWRAFTRKGLWLRINRKKGAFRLYFFVLF